VIAVRTFVDDFPLWRCISASVSSSVGEPYDLQMALNSVSIMLSYESRTASNLFRVPQRKGDRHRETISAGSRGICLTEHLPDRFA
jgi:hypothetical protein